MALPFSIGLVVTVLATGALALLLQGCLNDEEKPANNSIGNPAAVVEVCDADAKPWLQIDGCDSRDERAAGGDSCSTSGTRCDFSGDYKMQEYKTMRDDLAVSSWKECADMCDQKAECSRVAYNHNGGNPWCIACSRDSRLVRSVGWGVFQKPCESNCKCCSRTSNATCTKCVNSKYLHASSCVSSCPSRHFGSGVGTTGRFCQACEVNCQTCSDEATCSKCGDGKYLHSSSCVNSCPSGHYGNGSSTIGRSCQECEVGCSNCRNASACIACKNTSYLHNEHCLAKCPSGFYGNGVSRSCQTCKLNCDTCSNSTVCTACTNSKYLFNSGCLSSCPAGYHGSGSALIGRSCIKDDGLAQSSQKEGDPVPSSPAEEKASVPGSSDDGLLLGAAVIGATLISSIFSVVLVLWMQTSSLKASCKAEAYPEMQTVNARMHHLERFCASLSDANVQTVNARMHRLERFCASLSDAESLRAAIHSKSEMTEEIRDMKLRLQQLERFCISHSNGETGRRSEVPGQPEAELSPERPSKIAQAAWQAAQAEMRISLNPQCLDLAAESVVIPGEVSSSAAASPMRSIVDPSQPKPTVGRPCGDNPFRDVFNTLDELNVGLSAKFEDCSLAPEPFSTAAQSSPLSNSLPAIPSQKPSSSEVHLQEHLHYWRSSNAHLLNMSGPIILSLEMLETRMEGPEKKKLRSSEPTCVWVQVKGRHELVISHACVDLAHIEALLAERFGMQQSMLTVSSVVYRPNSADSTTNITVGRASAHQLELCLLEANLHEELHDGA